MIRDTDIVYRYDGSFDGFLCCVYAAFQARENPFMILGEDEMQSILFETRMIETDMPTAQRVADAIRWKISEEALEFVRFASLTAMPGHEKYTLSFLRVGFHVGGRILNDLADPTVSRLNKAVLHLQHEAHLYTGFIRFQASGGVLTSVIEPKNRVLPLLIDHFRDRFSAETFLIYDKTHREALVYTKGEARILRVDALNLPAPDEAETRARALWRAFVHAIAIPERENPVCQRGHMPKRYWPQMTEHQTDDTTTALPDAAGI